MKGQAYRAPTAAPMTDTEIWDACTAKLLGPVVTRSDRDHRRHNALLLAAAALRAAGADDLAAQAQHRITV